MNTITIKATQTFVTRRVAIALLDGGFVANSATVNYCRDGNLDTCPLILQGTIDGVEMNVNVYCKSDGRGGSGPHTAVDILKAAGFEVDSGEILKATSEAVYLNYSKE